MISALPVPVILFIVARCASKGDVIALGSTCKSLLRVLKHPRMKTLGSMYGALHCYKCSQYVIGKDFIDLIQTLKPSCERIICEVCRDFELINDMHRSIVSELRESEFAPELDDDAIRLLALICYREISDIFENCALLLSMQPTKVTLLPSIFRLAVKIREKYARTFFR